jgi:hypothetical protein
LGKASIHPSGTVLLPCVVDNLEIGTQLFLEQKIGTFLWESTMKRGFFSLKHNNARADKNEAVIGLTKLLASNWARVPGPRHLSA